MIKRIAFVYTGLFLGGSEQVSYTTASYLKKWNVSSYFFSTQTSPHAIQRMSDVGVEYHALPDSISENLFSEENLHALENHFHFLGIEIAVFMAYERRITQEIKMRLNCKVILWHHMIPLYELEEFLDHKRGRAMHSFRSWIDYYLRAIWLYHYFPCKRKGLEMLYRRMLEIADYYFVLCPKYVYNIVDRLKLPSQIASKIIPMTNTYKHSDVPLSCSLDKKKKLSSWED